MLSTCPEAGGGDANTSLDPPAPDAEADAPSESSDQPPPPMPVPEPEPESAVPLDTPAEEVAKKVVAPKSPTSPKANGAVKKVRG